MQSAASSPTPRMTAKDKMAIATGTFLSPAMLSNNCCEKCSRLLCLCESQRAG